MVDIHNGILAIKNKVLLVLVTWMGLSGHDLK